jgi:hypothetical protein
MNVDVAGACSDCGNNKCESWENECNCPKDCGYAIDSKSECLAAGGKCIVWGQTTFYGVYPVLTKLGVCSGTEICVRGDPNDCRLKSDYLLCTCPSPWRKIQTSSGYTCDPEYVALKPAVYLYPEEDMNIDVTVDAEIIKSEPAYGKGWSVNVNQDGLINGVYDYLFYEAIIDEVTLPVEGWSVKNSDLETFFDDTLTAYNLNVNEMNEFKEFWLETLKADYYTIYSLDKATIDKHMPLNINPKPDFVSRLYFVFKEEEELVNIQSPTITPFVREGYYAIEWGGEIRK